MALLAAPWLLAGAASVLAHPCDRDPGHKHCDSGDGGGGSTNDSGTDLKLSCLFMDNDSDNVTSDGRGAYVDAVDKVGCSTGGTSQPNLSGIVLDPMGKGKFRSGDRTLELAFGSCYEAGVSNRCYDTEGNPDGLPSSIFTDGEAEQVWMVVRPYREDAPDGLEGHIQTLPDGEHNMAVRFNLKRGNADPRVVINIAARHVTGDKFQGTLCDPFNADIQDTLATDALVVAGPTAEDRFIVTTEDGINDHVGPDSNDVPGDGGFMQAAVCSSIPPDGHDSCDGAGDSGLCNFHGFVNVKFTMTADVLQ